MLEVTHFNGGLHREHGVSKREVMIKMVSQTSLTTTSRRDDDVWMNRLRLFFHFPFASSKTLRLKWLFFLLYETKFAKKKSQTFINQILWPGSMLQRVEQKLKLIDHFRPFVKLLLTKRNCSSLQ